jgi:hypothetical protein
LVWQFEGLLYSHFGTESATPWCIDTTKPKVGGYVVAEWFMAGDACYFLDTHEGYVPVFGPHEGSTLTLSAAPWKHNPHADFGNYPEQILVDGHSVACPSPAGSFLVTYVNNTFGSLGCIKPSKIP